jgi:uncharacterized damage-inducible protein DinB
MDRDEPRPDTGDPVALFGAYLRFYRETAIAKVDALSPEDQRTSRLPSGWTPLELLLHLAHMERRWFLWNFEGEEIEAPWGDRRDGRWYVAPDVAADDVATALRQAGEHTEAVLASRELDEWSQPPADYPGPQAPLGWICFHVLQEYARHVGHLDIAVELAGGPTGE